MGKTLKVDMKDLITVGIINHGLQAGDLIQISYPYVPKPKSLWKRIKAWFNYAPLNEIVTITPTTITYKPRRATLWEFLNRPIGR